MRSRAVAQYALVIAFLILPVAFLSFGPRYVPLSIEAYIALVVISVLTGIPAAVFFVLSLVMNLRRLGRSVDIAYIQREYQYTAWAALFVAITIAFALATTFTPVAPVYAALVLAYVLAVVPASARQREFRVAIIVNCAPQEAFDFVSDPRNVSHYLPQAELVGPVSLPVRVGSILRYRVREGRFVLEGDETVVEITPNIRFASQSTPMSRGTYTFTPVDGRTGIAYTYLSALTISQAVLGGAVAPRRVTRLMIGRREAGLRRLKEILEAPAPASC